MLRHCTALAVAVLLATVSAARAQDQAQPAPGDSAFASREALAARLWSAGPGTELPVYIARGGEIHAKVNAVMRETLNGPGGSLSTRRFDVALQGPDRPIRVSVVVDERLRLVRWD